MVGEEGEGKVYVCRRGESGHGCEKGGRSDTAVKGSEGRGQV